MSYSNSESLPSTSGLNYSQQAVTNYLSRIHAENRNIGFGVCQYTHGQGTSLPYTAYVGGCYSPTQNRIYLAPFAQGNPSKTQWHYIDCTSGQLVAYTHGVTTVSYAYLGGVYHAALDRIYFNPYHQDDQTYWHYVDCKDGTVHSYVGDPTPYGMQYANWGGSYLPSLSRVYFSTYAQWTTGAVNYVDSSGVVQRYMAGALDAYAYQGSCYCPTLDRLYLVPCNITGSTWHYIDGATGLLTGYPRGPVAIVPVAYAGGVYSPVQDRIYFIPFVQTGTWHYIDCRTGDVVTYAAADLLGNRYIGGVYSPVSNRIYLVDNSGAPSANWHYIDCSNDTPTYVAYQHGITGLQANPYQFGVFSPTNNRIYLLPYNAQEPQANWHYIQEYSCTKVSPALMAGPAFNKS